MQCDDSRLIKEFYDLNISTLMDKKYWDLPVIEQSAPIGHILSILDGKSHVWVVENLEKRNLIGVVTRQDVLHILAPPRKYQFVFSIPKQYIHGTCGFVEDIMTKNPITCESNETIVQVLVKMMRHHVRRLAVVEKESLIGEITLEHLIHKYYLATQFYSINNNSKSKK